MNKLNLKNKKQGFTIIEVVLVLAIAGLIFLIVFLALPGLQRSRRDTQRKNDVGKMVGAIVNYQSSHSSKLPSYPSGTGTNIFASSSCTQGNDCVIKDDGVWNDPSTSTPYELSGLSVPTKGKVSYIPGFKCDNNGGSNPDENNLLHYIATASPNVGYILMPLESGGYYCKDTGA